jgi:hypothetical protein
MSRVRISTTVDSDRLEACRQLLRMNDSKLMDMALAALLEVLESERERRALEAMPYDRDPALAWEAPEIPSLPYDGDVPDDVRDLSQARRQKRRK